MFPITFYHPDGRVHNFTTVPNFAVAQDVAAMLGLAYITGSPPGDDYYVEEGGFVQMPARPSPAHTFDWSTKTWIDPRTLEDLRAERIAEIDREFEERAAALTAGYPSTERLTWPTQQAEALAWAANNAAPTPYLDGLAAARQIDVGDMRQRTLEAVQLFMAASQLLVGTRQRLRDLVAAATSPEAIANIAWPGDQT